MVFKIPSHMEPVTFGENITPPGHLAFVEWFTVPREKSLDHGMYQVSHSYTGVGTQRVREVAVVEVDSIVRICQLIPCFGKKVNRAWSSETVLDDCDTGHGCR